MARYLLIFIGLFFAGMALWPGWADIPGLPDPAAPGRTTAASVGDRAALHSPARPSGRHASGACPRPSDRPIEPNAITVSTLIRHLQTSSAPSASSVDENLP
jgi:hypothetical protein